MIKQPKIPDLEARKRNVERLRESNRQLDIFGAALDEVLAMAELELCRQRRKRLETKYQQIAENVGE